MWWQEAESWLSLVMALVFSVSGNEGQFMSHVLEQTVVRPKAGGPDWA